MWNQQSQIQSIIVVFKVQVKNFSEHVCALNEICKQKLSNNVFSQVNSSADKSTLKKIMRYDHFSQQHFVLKLLIKTCHCRLLLLLLCDKGDQFGALYLFN